MSVFNSTFVLPRLIMVLPKEPEGVTDARSQREIRSSYGERGKCNE